MSSQPCRSKIAELFGMMEIARITKVIPRKPHPDDCPAVPLFRAHLQLTDDFENISQEIVIEIKPATSDYLKEMERIYKEFQTNQSERLLRKYKRRVDIRD